MKIVDRHVLAQCLQTFALALCAFVGLLLLQNVYDNLKDLIDYGAGMGGILHYYAVLLPSYLPTILPIVFMIAVILSLGRLHQQNEIIAMRACGLDLWSITRSIWWLALLLTALMFVLNAKVVPWSVERSREIWDGYSYASQIREQGTEDVGIVRSLAYNDYQSRRLWFFNRFSKYNNRAWGITISQLDAQGREKSRIYANEGHYDEQAACWVLSKGRIVSFGQGGGDIVRSVPFGTQAFAELAEHPQLMLLRQKRAKDLSFNELHDVLAHMPLRGDPDRRGFLVRYYSMAASPLICLVAVGLAVPFAVTGVRVNPMVGLSKSLGLFLLYFAIASVCTALGSQGKVEPLTAVLLPPTCAAALALVLYRRAKFS